VINKPRQPTREGQTLHGERQNDKRDRLKGIEVGCDDFLVKPFDATELQARIQSLVRLKRYTDELESAEAVILGMGATLLAAYSCWRLRRGKIEIGPDQWRVDGTGAFKLGGLRSGQSKLIALAAGYAPDGWAARAKVRTSSRMASSGARNSTACAPASSSATCPSFDGMANSLSIRRLTASRDPAVTVNIGFMSCVMRSPPSSIRTGASAVPETIGT
jgi:hypothetical protein